MMKNLKINTKLSISFGLVLIMLFICAGVSINNLNIMGKQINQYAGNTKKYGCSRKRFA